MNVITPTRISEKEMLRNHFQQLREEYIRRYLNAAYVNERDDARGWSLHYGKLVRALA